MNTEHFKRRLLAEEHRLVTALGRREKDAANLDGRPIGDAADVSVAGDIKEEQFREANQDWTLLRQVREALQRIAEGTYGQCAVDGGPIEEARLEAVPWTPYCKQHQEMQEKNHPVPVATL